MDKTTKQEVRKRLKKRSECPRSGCWEWQASVIGGYGQIKFQGKSWLVHRLSWRIHFGKIPKGLYVCHSCDNRRCWRPSHLMLGSHTANMIDKVQKGRHRAHEPKLTAAKVRAIRRRYRAGETLAQLAEAYGVGQSYLSKIVRGKRWRYAKGPRTAVGPTGRARKGEQHGNAKMTEEKVQELRELRAEGALLSDLAERYGISVALVSKIALGDFWKDAGGPLTRKAVGRRNQLTDVQVQAIRERYASGEAQTSLAREFSISNALASMICQGQVYADSGGPISAPSRGRKPFSEA
jgi:transposase-like protein